MIIIKTHFIFYFTEILLNVQQGTWRPFWRYQMAEPLQGRHHSGIVQLTVSPDGTDHVRVHELIHDHGVTPGKVTPQELRAVGDLSCAEVTLQPVLHF